uniref:Uncharacterized protein n=1 Tax=Triticum urartu TaxID=4572 RepID=A0A8R7V1H2_TRIUA
MEDHFGRRISREEEEAVVKPTRSFRYEDYSTRRVFLRSYPLQWDSPAPGGGVDEKQGGAEDDDEDRYGDGGGHAQVHVIARRHGELAQLLVFVHDTRQTVVSLLVPLAFPCCSVLCA